MTDRAPHRAIFVASFGMKANENGVGFHAFPSPEPQTFPRHFIEAAIAAGCAHPVPRRRKAAPDTPRS